MRFWYFVTVAGAQVQGLSESPKYPHGQGFILAIKVKLGGKGKQKSVWFFVYAMSIKGTPCSLYSAWV